jgi:hypothetical protein
MKAADVSFRSFSVWENHRDRCHAMPHLHCPPRLATKNVEFTIGFQWGKVTPLWLGLVIIINHLIYYHLLLLIDFWASPIPTTNKFVSVQYVSALYESNILSSSDMYVYIYITSIVKDYFLPPMNWDVHPISRLPHCGLPPISVDFPGCAYATALHDLHRTL